MPSANAKLSPVVRYQLVLHKYPNLSVIPQICRLIYDIEDKNLLASLNTLPYTVGRSFSEIESKQLHETLKNLGVAHRFESQTPGARPIFFTGSDEVEGGGLLDWGSRKKILKGVAFFFAGVAIATAFIFLKWPTRKAVLQDSNNMKSELQLNANYEAKVMNLVKDVEVKADSEFGWKKAAVEMKLNRQDSIRTFEDSEATLRYREGSSILVKPNTLLVVGEAKPKIEDLRVVHLEDGSIRANLKKDLSIVTPRGTLEVRASESGGEARIETNIKKGTLHVQVSKGAAVLRPERKDMKTVEIKSGSQLEATTEKVSDPTPFHIPEIELKNPQNEANINVDPRHNNSIEFKWASIPNASEYSWQLSADPDFKVVLLRQQTKEDHLILNYLDPGTLYWQVSTDVDGNYFQSQTRRIHVQAH